MRNHRKAMKEYKNLKKKDLSEMSSNEKSLFESFKEKEEKNKKRVARKSMIESNVSSTSTSTTQHLIGMESTLTPTTGTIVAHTSHSSTTSTIQKQNISSEFNEENVSDDEDNLFRDEDNLSDNEEITDFPCDDTHQDEPQQNNTLSTGGNILDSSSHSTSNKSSDSVIDNPSDTSRIALKTPEPEKKSSPIIQKNCILQIQIKIQIRHQCDCLFKTDQQHQNLHNQHLQNYQHLLLRRISVR